MKKSVSCTPTAAGGIQAATEGTANGTDGLVALATPSASSHHRIYPCNYVYIYCFCAVDALEEEKMHPEM